jgi:hypothetical protein
VSSPFEALCSAKSALALFAAAVVGSASTALRSASIRLGEQLPGPRSRLSTRARAKEFEKLRDQEIKHIEDLRGGQGAEQWRGL